MIIIKNRYQLMDYAENKGLHSIYDLLDKLKETDSAIACTDGVDVYVNPKEFNYLTTEDQFFILCHEMLHILYHHTDEKYYPHDRYQDRELLNICQDVVINEYLQNRLKYRESHGVYFDNLSKVLLTAGYIKAPLQYKGVLDTPSLYLYLERRKILHPDLVSILNAAGIEGDNKNVPPRSTSTKQHEQVLREACKTLKVTSKSLSQELNASVESILKDEDLMAEDMAAGSLLTSTGQPVAPKRIISTQDIIKYVQDFIGNQIVVKGRAQTYTRPSRRYQSKDFLMKGYKHTKTVKELAIYLDTSGSMDGQFIADMYNTLKVLYKTTKFKLYEFTYSVSEVNVGKTELYAGGGTNIKAVLDHLNKTNFDHAIMITDCQDNFSLRGFKKDLMIFTNMYSFTTNNPHVKVTYFK